MKDQQTLETLKATKLVLLQTIRRNGAFAACAFILLGLLCFALHTNLRLTLCILVMPSIPVTFTGLAYLILGRHIRRLTRD